MNLTERLNKLTDTQKEGLGELFRTGASAKPWGDNWRIDMVEREEYQTIPCQLSGNTQGFRPRRTHKSPENALKTNSYKELSDTQYTFPEEVMLAYGVNLNDHVIGNELRKNMHSGWKIFRDSTVELKDESGGIQGFLSNCVLAHYKFGDEMTERLDADRTNELTALLVSIPYKVLENAIPEIVNGAYKKAEKVLNEFVGRDTTRESDYATVEDVLNILLKGKSRFFSKKEAVQKYGFNKNEHPELAAAFRDNVADGTVKVYKSGNVAYRNDNIGDTVVIPVEMYKADLVVAQYEKAVLHLMNKHVNKSTLRKIDPNVLATGLKKLQGNGNGLEHDKAHEYFAEAQKQEHRYSPLRALQEITAGCKPRYTSHSKQSAHDTSHVMAM